MMHDTYATLQELKEKIAREEYEQLLRSMAAAGGAGGGNNSNRQVALFLLALFLLVVFAIWAKVCVLRPWRSNGAHTATSPQQHYCSSALPDPRHPSAVPSAHLHHPSQQQRPIILFMPSSSSSFHNRGGTFPSYPSEKFRHWPSDISSAPPRFTSYHHHNLSPLPSPQPYSSSMRHGAPHHHSHYPLCTRPDVFSRSHGNRPPLNDGGHRLAGARRCLL